MYNTIIDKILFDLSNEMILSYFEEQHCICWRYETYAEVFIKNDSNECILKLEYNDITGKSKYNLISTYAAFKKISLNIVINNIIETYFEKLLYENNVIFLPFLYVSNDKTKAYGLSIRSQDIIYGKTLQELENNLMQAS